MRLAAAILLSSLVLLRAARPGEVRIASAPYHPPSAAIAVETNLVELRATVRDRSGKPVRGLHSSDFVVLDNLKPRTITFFSEERNAQSTSSSAPQPRSIALFFDDTHSGLASFDRAKHAAEKLISNGVQHGDRIAIFTGSGTVTLDFTADSKALLAAITALRRHPDQPGNSGFGACPTLTAYQAYLIAKRLDLIAKDVAAADILGCAPQTPWKIAQQQAQDAAEAAWDQLRHQSSNVLDALIVLVHRLAAQPGARILMMVSPGFVTGEMEKQTGILTDACLRARIVVNSLDDEGLLGAGSESPESLGARTGPRAAWAQRSLTERDQIVTAFLADTAAATGGEFIHNSNDLTFPNESSYLLGFSPSDTPDGKYHKLKVTVAKPANYEVKTRAGYFSTPQSQQPETAQQRIDRVVASGELLNQIPATVKAYATPDKDGHSRIQVDIALDARQVPFGPRDGLNLQQLTFVTVLEDAAGNFMEGKQALMDLALTAPTRTDLEQKGIHASTSFQVPAGSYRIREVIREAVHNQMSAINSPIEIH